MCFFLHSRPVYFACFILYYVHVLATIGVTLVFSSSLSLFNSHAGNNYFLEFIMRSLIGNVSLNERIQCSWWSRSRTQVRQHDAAATTSCAQQFPTASAASRPGGRSAASRCSLRMSPDVISIHVVTKLRGEWKAAMADAGTGSNHAKRAIHPPPPWLSSPDRVSHQQRRILRTKRTTEWR